MKDKVRKNIDLSESAVKVLSKAAIDAGTVFKLYVEDLLEKIAKGKKK